MLKAWHRLYWLWYRLPYMANSYWPSWAS